jgi:hypothetical protein
MKLESENECQCKMQFSDDMLNCTLQTNITLHQGQENELLTQHSQ